jgi:hypothetical protein
MRLDYEYRSFNELPKTEKRAWTGLAAIYRTVNPLVGGSNPSRGAIIINSLRFFPMNLLRYSRVCT